MGATVLQLEPIAGPEASPADLANEVGRRVIADEVPIRRSEVAAAKMPLAVPPVPWTLCRGGRGERQGPNLVRRAVTLNPPSLCRPQCLVAIGNRIAEITSPPCQGHPLYRR